MVGELGVEVVLFALVVVVVVLVLMEMATAGCVAVLLFTAVASGAALLVTARKLTVLTTSLTETTSTWASQAAKPTSIRTRKRSLM